jgi:hypothetical protein
VAPIFRSAAAPGGREKVTHGQTSRGPHPGGGAKHKSFVDGREREYTLFYINNESPSLPVTTELARNVVVAAAAAVDRY